MNDDDQGGSPTDLRPVTPGPASGAPGGRRGLRRRTATLATMGGLTAGAVIGGIAVSHAADQSSSSSSSSTAAGSSSGSTTAPSGSGTGSAPATAGGSNEDATHERGESTQREADENSGAFHGGPRGPRGPGHGGLQGEDQQLVATAIGISTAQLQTELTGSKTIADVARAHSADVNALISTWVASENKEIDDRVSSGALTRAQGDQAKTMTEQRVTDRVNGPHR